MTRKLTIITILLFSFLTVFSQTENDTYWKKLPKHTGWVNDFENIFTEEQETTLDSLIVDYEKRTTTEIAVITIPTNATDKEKFDDFVLQIGNYWGVGKKGKNNGILIGISKGHRKIRISNGLGIEKLLTDNQTKQIVDKTFIPNFKKHAFYEGTLQGIQEIIKILEQEPKSDFINLNELTVYQHIELLKIDSINTNGQTAFCKEFRTGVFQFAGSNGGVYTIIRTDTSQYERNTRNPHYSMMSLRWESECQYTLYDRVEYRRRKEPKKDTLMKEIRNIVWKFEKPNKFYVKTFIDSFADTVETIFTKLDTSKYLYNNLFQLKEYEEYKNAKAYGQTLLGEIHSIEYYESKIVPNKYLIIFETTYQDEPFNKTRLLDTIIVNLKPKELITNSGCRVNGKFDDEIIAIYSSENQEQEAKIIRAFRCNRQTEKIVEVDVNTVQYKEADRNRIKW